MDFVKKLGALAIAVRLRRISDLMVQDGRKMYQIMDAGIEPNWLLVFLLLREKPELSVTEIADALKFAHPSIHTMVNKMIKKGYLAETMDNKDKRRRLLSLTEAGNKKLLEMEPVWEKGAQGVEKLIAETGYDVMAVLDTLEERLHKRGFKDRTIDEIEAE